MLFSGIGKHAEFSGIHAVQDYFVLCIGGFFVSLIRTLVNGSGISETVHQEYYREFFYFLLLQNNFLSIFNRSFPGMPKLFLVSFQFVNDHSCHGLIVVQDILITRDIIQSLFMISQQCVDLQTDQLVQTHLQDSGGLYFGETKPGCLFF